MTLNKLFEFENYSLAWKKQWVGIKTIWSGAYVMVNEPWASMAQIIKYDCVPLIFVSAANLTKSSRAPLKLDSRDLRPFANCLIWFAKILSEYFIVPILFLQHEFCFLITSFAATNCSFKEFKNKSFPRTRKSVMNSILFN